MIDSGEHVPVVNKKAAWVAAEQAELDRWVAALPPMVVTLQEFEELSEYSASYPTGTTPGKIWRTEINCYHHQFIRAGGKPRWIIRQYDPNHRPEDPRIKILQFRPVFRVKATSRPSNFYRDPR